MNLELYKYKMLDYLKDNLLKKEIYFYLLRKIMENIIKNKIHNFIWKKKKKN